MHRRALAQRCWDEKLLRGRPGAPVNFGAENLGREAVPGTTWRPGAPALLGVEALGLGTAGRRSWASTILGAEELCRRRHPGTIWGPATTLGSGDLGRRGARICDDLLAERGAGRISGTASEVLLAGEAATTLARCSWPATTRARSRGEGWAAALGTMAAGCRRGIPPTTLWSDELS